MSHQKKIEQVLDLLINEEHEAASDLLHSVIVDKARGLYEELVDEDFGDDEKSDFADEIEADDSEIDSEEEGDAEFGDEDDAEDAPEEEEIEDRVEDLESEFAELKAEFDALVGDEMGEPEHDDMEMGDLDMDGDMDVAVADDEVEVEGMYEEDVDDLDEATKLQDEQKADLSKEDQLSAKGGSEKSADKKSMFSTAPKKADHGGKPHETGRGGDESGKKASQGKDHTPEDNIDVPQKKQSAKAADGDDNGAESILGAKGTPRGK